VPDALRQRAAEHHAPAWCEVNLAVIRRNAERLSAHLGTPLAPVLKADAYGLGAVAVAHALERTAPWGYCVATVAEGRALRDARVTRPVLVCPPLMIDELAEAHAAGLMPALGTGDAIAQWQALRGGAWHLAIDTGMNRAGLRWDAVRTVHAALAANPPQGVFTHFHSADRPDGSMAEQEARFATALGALPSRPSFVHTDNSAAAARRTTASGDFARPGLFLYGGETGSTARITPEPVAAVRARIVEVRPVSAGETVSYDGAWRASSPRLVATVSLGYADGYRRALGTRAWMLVRGRRAPVIGWVTMDMTMLDITDTGAQVGDVATALGADGEESITLGMLAGLAECSAYELLVALRLRLPHFYRDQA
jgi:alanine racemase